MTGKRAPSPPKLRVHFIMTAPGTAREEHQAMEFSVTKSALLNELNTTQGVVERKTTHVSKSACRNPRKSDRQDEVCHLHGGVTLHAKWRTADLEAGHAGDGGDGRPPACAGRNRPQTCGTERRSESAHPEESHGRSGETFQRRQLRCAHRFCEG